MAIDSARIEAAVVEMLSAIGEDPARLGLVDTSRSSPVTVTNRGAA